MKESWYQTVGGRPLVYLFGHKEACMLPRLRAACRKVGARDPYAVALRCERFSQTGDDGVQAISAYAECG